MSDYFDLPPPPPLEDDTELTPVPPPRKRNLPNNPNKSSDKAERGLPPVIPRTMDVRKSSIAIRNNLLFRMSQTPIELEDLPPAPPKSHAHNVGKQNEALGKSDPSSSLYSLFDTNNKPSVDIEIKNNTPVMTLKGPGEKVLDQFESKEIDNAFKHERAEAKRDLPEAPKYSQYDADLFRYINEARSVPSKFIPILEQRLAKFENGTNNLITGKNSRLVTHEGPAAVQEAIQYLKKASPLKKINWNNTLAKVCQDHVEEIGAAGLYDSKMKDGSQPTDKVLEQMGGSISTAAESIKFTSNDPLETIVDFIVDDGVQSRGNRSNIFGDWDMMGCFTGLHSISDTMTTLLFAQTTSKSSSILQTLMAKINETTTDPPNWAQKQQKIVYTGDELKVTNLYLMKDGSQKTVEIIRKIRDNQLV